MDMSGVIDMGYLNALNCVQLLNAVNGVDPNIIAMFYTMNSPPLPPVPPVAAMRINEICNNTGMKMNLLNQLMMMNRPQLLQALQSIPVSDLLASVSNWGMLRTNLISDPNEFSYLWTLYPTDCNNFYNSYNSTTLINMIKDADGLNFIRKALDINLSIAGNILPSQKAIMTFIVMLNTYISSANMETIWYKMVGSYGQYYSSFQLSELDLYGAKRLGTIQDTLKLNSFYFNGSYNAASNSYNISSTFAPTYGASVNYYLTSFTYGKKQYEITNHLGNVLSTVADYKLPYLNSSGKLCYYPDVRSENKYYAFGGAKDGNWSVNNYSYGYQGSLKNNGLDGTINTFYRQGDVEGLFWTSVDPKFYLTPWESPYSLMGGNPVVNTDVLGDIIGQRREKVDYGEEFTVADFGYRAFNDVKHSIENLALTFRKADPGMKWKADYIRDEFGQETYGGTVIKQVPSEGKIIDIVEKAFDVLTVVSVGSFNGKDLILAAKTAAKPSVVKAIGQVIKSNFIHGKTSHMNVLEEVAKKYADNGGIAFIHKALNTALGKKIQSIGRLLPDVTVIKSDGSIHLLEMQSPGQSLDKLRRKLRIMASELNKEGYKVTTELRDVNGKVVK